MTVVGVLALQGAVVEHLQMLARLNVKGVAVKGVEDLKRIDALIIPGGESTAISRLIQQQGMAGEIIHFAKKHPVMGTCAGLILCAKAITPDDPRVTPLQLIDITVARNGFGRQVDSFETSLTVTDVGQEIPAVFIRAPFIESVGQDVVVLASIDNKIVMAEHQNILVMSFHPELTNDSRVLDYFLKKCVG